LEIAEKKPEHLKCWKNEANLAAVGLHFRVDWDEQKRSVSTLWRAIKARLGMGLYSLGI
jgi:hypothetical protein